MNKIDMNKLLKSAQLTLKRRSPEILTGIGIAGMITSTILAVKATPKAMMLIEERKLDLDTEDISKVEVVKTVWPCYIPTIVLGGMSVACLIGASSINFRRNAALTTAYAISETALKDYREKVIETIGEKKETTVQEALTKDKIDKNPVDENEIVLTNQGESLCYDPFSGRYFRSNIDKIKRALNELNNMILKNEHASLNDFYCEIGLGETKNGDEIGWSIQKSGMTDIRFDTHLASNGEPCIVIDFSVTPDYTYLMYY